MKSLLVVAVVSSCLLLLGCPTIAEEARDTSAALSGVLVAAQDRYLISCQANSRQTVCDDINKAGAAQNALITAAETYCGWPVKPVTSIPTETCVPVKDATNALSIAIQNAQAEILSIKAVLN